MAYRIPTAEKRKASNKVSGVRQLQKKQPKWNLSGLPDRELKSELGAENHSICGYLG